MRRRLAVAAAVLPAALLATACSSTHQPSMAAPGPSHVDVGSKDLVALKKQTHVPDCPRVLRNAAAGGMPSVTLPCLGGGRAVDVAGLRGPMVVNFWASWCDVCRKEMPALARYARTHPGVRVVGVDFLDTQPGAALQLAGASGVGYPLLADPDARLDRNGPIPHLPGLPFTAYVDASGRVVHREFGALTTAAAVASAVHRYLGVAG